MQETVAKRHPPVWNRLFVFKKLIDVPALNVEQILALCDSINHGVEFIRIEPKKETGRPIEVDQQLPISALG
jgi:hypothetical protein